MKQSQSLPPNFRISEYKTQQDRGVQTSDNRVLEQHAQALVADLKKLVRPTQSRATQTDTTYNAKDDETFERRVQVLRGHFQTDTGRDTLSTQPPDFLPWHLETIAGQETLLADTLDNQIQQFTEKAETSPLYEKYLEKFQGSINAQRDALTTFYQSLQDLTNNFDPNSPQWQQKSRLLNVWIHDYQEGLVNNEEALACAALKNPELTPEAYHTALRKAAKRMVPLRDAIRTLEKEKDTASLSNLVNQWEAFREAEIARRQPATTHRLKL
jgi:hypothetical protein